MPCAAATAREDSCLNGVNIGLACERGQPIVLFVFVLKQTNLWFDPADDPADAPPARDQLKLDPFSILAKIVKNSRPK